MEQLDKKKICMLVLNNFVNDSRVLKEAKCLSTDNYEITVIAKLDDETSPEEVIEGIRVFRVKSIPSLYTYLSGRERWRVNVKHGNVLTIFSIPLIFFMWLVRGLRNFLSGIIKWIELYFLGSSKEGGEFSPPYQDSRLGSYVKKGLRMLFRRVGGRSLAILKLNISFFRVGTKEHYDVVHAHDLNTLIAGYFLARRHSAKLVYDSHELYLERNRYQPYSKLSKYLRKIVESYLIKRSDVVITVNRSIAKILRDRYSVSLPLVVMNVPDFDISNNSVHKTRSLRKAVGIGCEYKILLYVGAITFNRGIEKIILALEELPNCFLVLMGHGSEEFKEKLVSLAVEKSVDSRFSFFGPVPSREVVEYASSADLGVAPIENVCLSYYYCSPNKMFEYLSAGLPVIASNFPELSYLINKFKIGETFDPASSVDIVRAAQVVLGDEELCRGVKSKAAGIISEYNWKKEAGKLSQAYAQLFA